METRYQTAEHPGKKRNAVPQDYVDRLLRSLGIFDQIANRPKLTARSLDLFASRELAFDWIHMGNAEITIGQLIRTIQQSPFLVPPRTGHIGNWSNMVHGRAGPRDYNYIAFGPQRLAYPLVFDFNQTESEGARGGDWSYMPGSLVERAEREALDLYSWDGVAFRKRDRREPLFVPFILTTVGDGLLPLSRLHRIRLDRLGSFRFQSELFARREGLVRSALHVLFEEARYQARPEQLLKRIVDRYVTLDGRVTRAIPEVSGAGFTLDNARYGSIGEIAEHVTLTIALAADPESFVERVADLPSVLPLPANALVQLLCSITHSHYPELDEVPVEMRRPCNPHVQWGGIPMAGYPPTTHGYFSNLAKHMKKLCRALVRHLPEIEPVFDILLPAAVFNLCPNDSFPEDVDCLARLMALIRADTVRLVGKPSEMNQRIEQIVHEWRPEAEKRLSTYMIGHFGSPAGAADALPEPYCGKPVLLPNFTELTMQQASMLMGALSQEQWCRGPSLAR